MTLFWWLVFSTVAIVYVFSDSVDSKTVKKFQFAIMQQNLQSIIISIEERLRNLDTIYSSRSNIGVEGALEQFSRKLDKIELKLDYIETIVHLKLEKISENMSAQFLKEDINRDHIKRKLDVIHENVNNRLSYNEIKLDTIGRSALENNNFLRNKLQKLEDRVTSRLSDVEVAISDSIVSIEEAKDVLSGNHTNDKLSDATEKTILEYFSILETKYDISHKQIANDIKIAESNIKSSINKSYEVIIDIEDNFNEFSNKISEIGDTIYDKAENFESNAIGLASLINMTRNEMQNGFRTTLVQIGKSEKSKMLRDSSEVLNEMDKKIDNNFENVLLAQNIFLETCHRLQMDESQMENKIGDIFQKLLDTLDAKMLVEADDVKELNKVLKGLTSTIRKPIIEKFDIPHMNDILEQIKKSLETGINRTIEISSETLDLQYNLNWSLVDIRELIQSNLGGDKLALMSTTESSKDIDRNIDCIINGINCTQDILQNNETVNNSIVFVADDNNKQKNIYDIDVRTMNAAKDMSIVDGSNEYVDVNTRDSFDHDLVDESNVQELPEPQRIESPITE